MSPDPPTLARAARRTEGDYGAVRRAVTFVSQHWGSRPDTEAIARFCGVAPDELHRLFRRWAGLTPTEFMAAIARDRVRRPLRGRGSAPEAACAPGRSQPARSPDLFVTHEATSPGAWKARGPTLVYGFHSSPFGHALVAATEHGLAGLAFADRGEKSRALDDMRRRWPQARWRQDGARTAGIARRIFDPARWREDRPLHVVMIGTDFEVGVWEALLRIPMGRVTTYSDIATKIHAPRAARAVGAAIGKNPIAFVVPCHRVIGKCGDLTGYRWGLIRKRVMLGWEAGRVA
jgi:AraC family transcriptional regulator, regulatory protein of adaptative response / methylated-DNA-[protein]-cysteine methyltransferase